MALEEENLVTVLYTELVSQPTEDGEFRQCGKRQKKLTYSHASSFDPAHGAERATGLAGLIGWFTRGCLCFFFGCASR